MLPEHQAAALREVLVALAQRRAEALCLYEPMATQNRFHASKKKERLLFGSIRAGKTLSPAIEVARAVTGQDPFGKYPVRDGLCICIGKSLDHIGTVMWPKLGRAGAFKIIRDQQSGDWRAFKPWDPEDARMKDRARPAPPLICPRHIESIAWEEKKAGIPSVVKLKTGWEIRFYSGEGKPVQGFDMDLCWLDEEIKESQWYVEMLSRLLDRDGRIIWSAAAQAATQQFYEVHLRAKEAEVTGANVEEFQLLLDDNPHITAEAKHDLAVQLANNEEAYNVRIKGEFAIERHKVFPEFAEKLHVIEPFAVPPDWMRLLAVDPGRQVCAVAFLALPPTGHDLANQIFLYDELYIRECTAHLFGEQMERKTAGAGFDVFLIDARFARQRDVASGKTLQDSYAERLAARRITSAKTGSNFLWGCEVPESRIEAMRAWLRIQETGKPRLQVFNCCRNFIWEMKKWIYTRKKGDLTDKPLEKDNHLMDASGYLAAYDPVYTKPKRSGKRKSGAVMMLEMKNQKRKLKREALGEDSHIQLGPNPRR